MMQLTREKLEMLIDEEYHRVKSSTLCEALPDLGAHSDGMTGAQFVDIFIGQLESLAEEMAMELVGQHGNDYVVKLQETLERTLQSAVYEALADFHRETGLDVWPE